MKNLDDVVSNIVSEKGLPEDTRWSTDYNVACMLADWYQRTVVLIEFDGHFRGLIHPIRENVFRYESN